MKRFLVKFMLFAAPFVLLYGACLYFAWYIGDTRSLNDIVHEQLQPELVLYHAPLRLGVNYRTRAIAVRQPEVILLGSSRTFGFRDNLFNEDPTAFYNASIRTLDMQTMQQIGATYLQTHSPDVLILAIDQLSFNATYTRFWPDIALAGEPAPIMQRMSYLLSNAFQLEPDRFQHLLRRNEPVYEAHAIGYTAIMEGVGFRNDGSFQLGLPEFNMNRAALARSFDVPEHIYDEGTIVNPAAIAQVEALLQQAQRQGVYVIGIFPPFAPTVYAENFAANSAEYSYMTQASTALDILFNQYDYAFFDFSDGRDVTDAMMIDEWHLSERGSLIIYQNLLAALPDILGRYSDTNYLQQRLEDATHPLIIFGDET